MKITNSTRWNTEDIRRIIAAALVARGVPSTGLVVEIVYARSEYVSGRARIGYWEPKIGPNTPRKLRFGNWMLMRIPRPDPSCVVEVATSAKIVDFAPFIVHFARVVEHEVAHLAGLKHRDMSEALRYCRQPVPWLEFLSLRLDPEPAMDRAAAHDEKIDHAKQMLAKAVTRRKRAETIEKKWSRRVQMLEKKADK